MLKDPWPWEEKFDKRPRNGNVILFPRDPKTRIELLVKAGALIAAEIDNLLYKAKLATEKNPFAEP
jgi:hypothetical protein